jgi:hypothetical protein
MARTLQEFFEGAGYENAWTESVPGTCVVDEDAASSAAGSPPGWGSDCLEITLDGGGVDCFSYIQVGDQALFFFRVEFVVTSIGFDADAQQCTFFNIYNNALTERRFLGQLIRSAGVNVVALYVYAASQASPTLVGAFALSLNTRYRIEGKWDETNDLWEMRVEGHVFGSGSLSGGQETKQCGAIVLGDVLNSVRAVTMYLDRIEVDDAQYVIHSVALGQVTETDLAQAFGREKTRALAQVSTTELAQAFSVRKSAAIGQVLETDLAQAFGRAKAKGIGQVIETDEAFAMLLAGAGGGGAPLRINRPASLVALEDTMRLHFGTRSASTGAAMDADSLPVVTVEEDGVAMAYSPAVAKVTDGLYRTTFVVSAANGFEAGKRYSAWVEATVGGVLGREGLVEFEVLEEGGFGVDVRRVNGVPVTGAGVYPSDTWRPA